MWKKKKENGNPVPREMIAEAVTNRTEEEAED